MGRWNVNISPFDISLENLILRKLSNRAVARLSLHSNIFLPPGCDPCSLYSLGLSTNVTLTSPWLRGQVKSHISPLFQLCPPSKSETALECSNSLPCKPVPHSPFFSCLPDNLKKHWGPVTCKLSPTQPLSQFHLRLADWELPYGGGLLTSPQYGGNLKTDSPKASPPQIFHRSFGPWNRASAVAYGFFL